MTTDFGGSTYQEIEISGATGLQLVVMLYDGAIKFLTESKSCIQGNDVRGKALAIDRALAIIGELQATLNREEGGELAQSLDRLYTYMNGRILEASLKLTTKPLDETIKLLRTLNSGWTEIARRSGHPVSTHPSVAATLTNGPMDRGSSRPLELFG
jgi:flagellar protein FliS